MKLLLPLLLLLLSPALIAQNVKETRLSTSIDEVTVFLQGALVLRSGELALNPGRSVLLIEGLTSHLDAKSISVKATGDFTVLSVNHELDYLDENKKDQVVDSLQQLIDRLDVEMSKNTYRLQVLAEKQSLLDENKKLTGKGEGLSSIEMLNKAVEFYDQQLMEIKGEELDIHLKNRKEAEQKSRLELQISKVSGQEDWPSSRLLLRVETTASTKASFEISYFVSQAGWFPNYDLRVQSVADPVALTYKADVYQNTGVDWENVKLKFSNANPNQSGVMPQLSTWYLNYVRNTVYRAPAYGVASNIRKVSGRIADENGEPLIGASVLVQGTSAGTITDINGNYSMMIPEGAGNLTISYTGFDTQQVPIRSEDIDVVLNDGGISLDEVVVTGYGGRPKARAKPYEAPQEAEIVTTSTIENQTSVEFEVESPYTIKSDGSKLSVDLNKYEIDALYEYYAVPKLDRDAFLVARIIDWEQYNLLLGEANLFFEDTYVGRTTLEANALQDTLDISLGRDKSIFIERKKVDTYSKIRSLGSNRIETRGFEIVVRNKKGQPVEITIVDQIPIPAISDISVEPTELSGGRLDEKTGKISWELNLEARSKEKLILSYEVKYPKKERVALEGSK